MHTTIDWLLPFNPFKIMRYILKTKTQQQRHQAELCVCAKFNDAFSTVLGSLLFCIFKIDTRFSQENCSKVLIIPFAVHV